MFFGSLSSYESLRILLGVVNHTLAKTTKQTEIIELRGTHLDDSRTIIFHSKYPKYFLTLGNLLPHNRYVPFHSKKP